VKCLECVWAQRQSTRRYNAVGQFTNFTLAATVEIASGTSTPAISSAVSISESSHCQTRLARLHVRGSGSRSPYSLWRRAYPFACFGKEPEHLERSRCGFPHATANRCGPRWDSRTARTQPQRCCMAILGVTYPRRGRSRHWCNRSNRKRPHAAAGRSAPRPKAAPDRHLANSGNVLRRPIAAAINTFDVQRARRVFDRKRFAAELRQLLSSSTVAALKIFGLAQSFPVTLGVACSRSIR